MTARASFALVLLAGLVATGCRPEPVSPENGASAEPATPAAEPPENADPGLSGFRARGNEPFWALELDALALAWRPMDGGERVFSHLVHETLPQGHRVSGSLDGGALELEIENRLCRDSMSGMPYPQHVRVKVDGREYQGCGGEAISLLSASGWLVAQVFGTPVSNDPPTLNFTVDGRAQGFAGCNTWMAGTRLTGEGLAFDRAASTMMACPDRHMAQERAFLDALATITRHDFDEAGQLLLKSGDNTVIVASPVAVAGAAQHH